MDVLYEKLDIKRASGEAVEPVLRIAICGEVSSGKSTVLNALLRARILPDNIGSSRRPVVVASYRSKPGIEVLHSDGRQTSADTAHDPDLFRNAEHIRLWSDHDHLVGMEIIEVPLTKAEELTDEQIALVRSSDVMIWVTIASQAWRLTEKTIVEQLGDARPSHAILAVTRADKLRNDRDRDRLKERMIRETKDYFDNCIFINGARWKIEKAAQCDDTWAETGGAGILSAVETFADRIRARRAEELEAPATKPDPVEALNLTSFSEPRDFLENTDSPDRPEPEDASVPGDMAEEVEEAAESEVREVSTPDVFNMLRAMVAELSGVIVMGLRPEANPQTHEFLKGSAEQAHIVGEFCHMLLEGLTATLAANDEAGHVSAFNMSTHEHRVLFQHVPGVGLVYIMVDVAAMNHGIAQSTLSRICRELGSET